MAFKLDADSLDSSTVDHLQKKLEEVLYETVHGDWDYNKMAVGIVRRRRKERIRVRTVNVIYTPQCLSPKLAADFFSQVESVMEQGGRTGCVDAYAAGDEVEDVPLRAGGRDWSRLLHAAFGDETARCTRISEFLCRQSSNNLVILVGRKDLERVENASYNRVLICTLEADSTAPDLVEFCFSNA
ncbi:MAG: hypothetical protein DVB28_001418 [Verrucomicrobia bacterium]|nr:MAG: hypothetical protein DVB28_001418 [Verrucomicrobiota bacterium]